MRAYFFSKKQKLKGNMLNTGKGASVHEWTQEWETKYVGFVRKCRKGVICLMEHDYTKEVCTCLLNHQTFFNLTQLPPLIVRHASTRPQRCC